MPYLGIKLDRSERADYGQLKTVNYLLLHELTATPQRTRRPKDRMTPVDGTKCTVRTGLHAHMCGTDTYLHICVPSQNIMEGFLHYILTPP
jgi:hypothetical protein